MPKFLGDYTRYRWVKYKESWPASMQIGKKACRQHGHTVEVVGSRLYVIGGGTGSGPVRLFCYDRRVNEWRDLSAKGNPVPRKNFLYHASTFAGDQAFVLGTGIIPRLWKFDVVLEEWVFCENNSETIRSGRFMALEFMEHRNECFHIGGESGLSPEFAELNALRLDNMRWYKPEAKGTPPPQFAHMASCVVDSTIYTFAGLVKGAFGNDLYLLECAGHGAVAWSSPEVVGRKPPPRYNATITNLYSGKLLVVGGFRDDFYDDLWMYNIPAKTWIDLSRNGVCTGHIPRISQHAVAALGDKLMVIGGHDRELIDGYAELHGVLEG